MDSTLKNVPIVVQKSKVRWLGLNIEPNGLQIKAEKNGRR